MTKKKLELGGRGRDTVSGWEGVLTARYEYMNGCVRWELSAKDKDNLPKGYVFDEQQVEVVDGKPADAPAPQRTGGSQSSEPVAR